MNKKYMGYLKYLTAISLLSCVFIYGLGEMSSGVLVQSPTVIKNSENAKFSDKRSARTESEISVLQSHHMAKPGAAVSLKNTAPLYASAAGAFEYQLWLSSPSHTGKMIVDVSSGNGVAIVSPNHQFEFILNEGGEYLLPLTLYTESEGRFYIQLHVSMVVDGQASMRVITAILQVGAPSVKTQKIMTKSSADKADSVISLPAQETISPR